MDAKHTRKLETTARVTAALFGLWVIGQALAQALEMAYPVLGEIGAWLMVAFVAGIVLPIVVGITPKESPAEGLA